MKIVDDEEMNRDQAFAAIIFWMAEKKRHQQDIAFIDRCINAFVNKYDFSDDEVNGADAISWKYTRMYAGE